VGTETEAPGRPARRLPLSRVRKGAAWAAGILLVGALLMFCYLRTAGTVPLLSDGAGNALQAWQMLHGNVLLHGWWATDVSFYTTELPELTLIEVFTGLRPEVVHIGVALTYTILVLLAAYAARGRARGPEGAVRALIAGGIMLAPQPGAATWILQSSPDHVGTAVPVLIVLLVLDRAPRRCGTISRWYVPVLTAVLLAWGIVGDPLVEVIGSAALAVACLVRIVPRVRNLRAAGYELALLGAAAVSLVLARAADWLIPHLGGFGVTAARQAILAPPVVTGNLPLGWQSVLAIFGADYPDASGARDTAFAFVHLAGVALVLAAAVVAVWQLVRRLFRPPPAVGGVVPRGVVSGGAVPGGVVPGGAVFGGAGGGGGSPARDDALMADVLVIASVANVAAFLLVFRLQNIYTAHEIGPVLTFGAVLAGRIFGGPLVRAGSWKTGSPRWRRAGRVAQGAAAALLVCYAVMLGSAADRSQPPPDNVSLAAWLTGHGLRHGLAAYWQGNDVRLETSDRVQLLTVVPGRGGLTPRRWESQLALFDPATHTANFVVVVPGGRVTQQEAVAVFGSPARVYRQPGFTVLVWNKNLLKQLGAPVS
jgi:hypothetical protein